MPVGHAASRHRHERVAQYSYRVIKSALRRQNHSLCRDDFSQGPPHRFSFTISKLALRLISYKKV